MHWKRKLIKNDLYYATTVNRSLSFEEKFKLSLLYQFTLDVLQVKAGILYEAK